MNILCDFIFYKKYNKWYRIIKDLNISLLFNSCLYYEMLDYEIIFWIWLMTFLTKKSFLGDILCIVS